MNIVGGPVLVGRGPAFTEGINVDRDGTLQHRHNWRLLSGANAR